jgi:Fe-S oxidoreductase
MPVLEDIVFSGKLKLDPKRNDSPVTLYDPCNMVRLMGVVEPQRRILRKICPQLREIEPHGVENYCCGGGSGVAIMPSMNFPDWRSSVAGRMKLKQILDTSQDCKGQFRDLFSYYNVWEKCGILYGGLVKLIVNAIVDIKEPFIEREWR